MPESSTGNTKQIERLSHIQQRVANAAALSQARGITTWVIVGVIAALIQIFIKPELGESPRNWLRQAENGFALTSFLFIGLCIFGVLNELLRSRKSLELILPPNQLTLHFSINSLSAILASMQILFILAGWFLGTQIPKGWLIAAMFVSAFMIYSHFRSNRMKDSEEVFPGLHPFSLKYVYRRMGVFRKWSLMGMVFSVICIISFPLIMVNIYWLRSAEAALVDLFRSPLTLYFLGVIGLITYILIREGSFREIRSLKSLEKILGNQPNITDVQFGFMLRATHTGVASIVYSQVLEGYLSLSYQLIEAEYSRARERLPKVMTETAVTDLKFRLQELARDFNLQIMVYVEISKSLSLWIEKYLGKHADESWKRLLEKENDRLSRIESLNKTLFDQ